MKLFVINCGAKGIMKQRGEEVLFTMIPNSNGTKMFFFYFKKGYSETVADKQKDLFCSNKIYTCNMKKDQID